MDWRGPECQGSHPANARHRHRRRRHHRWKNTARLAWHGWRIRAHDGVSRRQSLRLRQQRLPGKACLRYSYRSHGPHDALRPGNQYPPKMFTIWLWPATNAPAGYSNTWGALWALRSPASSTPSTSRFTFSPAALYPLGIFSPRPCSPKSANVLSPSPVRLRALRKALLGGDAGFLGAAYLPFQQTHLPNRAGSVSALV